MWGSKIAVKYRGRFTKGKQLSLCPSDAIKIQVCNY